jgi:GTPase Era involved in 16S rRNA processing
MNSSPPCRSSASQKTVRAGNATEPPGPVQDIPSLMNEGIAILQGTGQGMEERARVLRALRQRLVEGRFHLAVVGQFKRGKSTLLNAMLGENILPSSVVPLTAIPTFIRFGPERSVRVHYQDRREEVFPAENANLMNKTLLAYVSEEVNPKNEKKVSYVEITHPSLILRDVVLIDTPGIGSTHRHNTEMTLNFLPQCDAALFLVSADPPITEVEVDFLRQVREKVARVFFVLNKVDYLSGPERDMALSFLQKVLSERIGTLPDGEVFAVSAKQALVAKENGDDALLAASGLPRVTEHLIDFLSREKTRVLREAVGNKALEVLHDALLQVGLEIRALELPVNTLEKKLSLFGEKIQEAERQRQYARDILAGDRGRVVALLEQESEALRDRARAHLSRIAEQSMDSGIDQGAATISESLSAEIPAYFEHSLGECTARFDREVTGILRIHQERADELIESVRVAASELFELPHHAPESERAFVIARDPYWVSRKSWSSTMSPISPEVIDRALPRMLREKRIRARLGAEIDSLVVTNVENLRWATLQNIDAAFRVFSRELDEQLNGTINATHGAIRTTFERRIAHEEEAAASLAALKTVSDDLSGVIHRFERGME